jgi:transcriptional regulator of acetoin/glycerol metabolism
MKRDDIDQLYRVVEGGAATPGTERVRASWRRSADTYGVNPASTSAPRILTRRELTDCRQPLDELILSAREEIDGLYRLVRDAGYTVLLCDVGGVAVEHRGDDSQARRFEYWGTWLGGVWAEQTEGTNGIGTCIAEERPVTIHRGQHFRSRHKDLSCSGAPLFNVDGTLIGVLDVSGIDPGLSEHAHALTGVLTVNSARAITERFFRERFRRQWIVAAALPQRDALGMLLAVDEEQRIVGADRVARRTLLLDDRKLEAGIDLWTIFARDAELFRRKEGADIPTQLIVAGSNETCPALITPPESISTAWRNPAMAGLHARPRLDSVMTIAKMARPQAANVKISPGAVRRVKEHVEAHLSQSVDLAQMAAVAGLSVFHFAREFRRATGVTPHDYVTRRRVERAQELLAHSGLHLSDIAVAVGFFDQSHMARHFRRILGTTPREFRLMHGQRPPVSAAGLASPRKGRANTRKSRAGMGKWSHFAGGHDQEAKGSPSEQTVPRSS